MYIDDYIVTAHVVCHKYKMLQWSPNYNNLFTMMLGASSYYNN